MLTRTQKNKIFTELNTSYTINTVAYTALKSWREDWRGELDTPVIRLHTKKQGVLVQGYIGRRREISSDILQVEVFAETDVPNSVHGADIVEDITRELLLWFKESGSTALNADGMKVGETSEVQDLSFIEERVFRKYFEVEIIYTLI